MGRTRSQWSRRLLAGVVATLIAAPVALSAQPAPANPLNISDIGVIAEVAKATVAAPGTVEISWLDQVTVNPNTGTLVRARFYNDGIVPQLDARITFSGGQVDTAVAYDPACGAGPRGSVVCNLGTVMPGETTRNVQVAYKVGTSAVTTTAAASATPDSLVPVEVIADNDETDSVTTNVAQNAGVAFLSDGETTSYTSPSGKSVQSFSVPNGATNGGGYFVVLSEESGSDSTCGTSPCYEFQAQADFVQVGGSTSPTTANPLTMTVSYPGVRQTCNGIGGPSGCNPIYFLPTGVTAGPATQVPNCTTYAPNGSTPFASSDPCLYGITPAANAAVTYSIALLKDIGWPIPKL